MLMWWLLQGPGEGDNELVARDYSVFRTDREVGRISSGTLILMDETYDAGEGHKLNTPNIQALEANIATGGSNISVAGVYRSS